MLSPSPGDSAGCSAESTAFFCAPRADRRPGLEETPPFGDLLPPAPAELIRHDALHDVPLEILHRAT